MLCADPLSRRPDHKEGVNRDNEGQTLLKPEFFAIKAISCKHTSHVDNSKLLAKIKLALENDKMTKDYKHLLSSSPCEFQKSLKEWNFKNGLLLHCSKVYVPKDQQLHLDLLKLHHNTLLAGHPGRWKTLELLACNYWWPGMSVDVKKYVQGCNACQQNKPSNKVPFGLLQLNKVPGAPWDIVTVDLITQLPLSINDNGNTWDAIMVVVDRLTKRAHFFPCGSNITAIQVATVFYEFIFPLHRLPCQIISN
jgi:hypothetical protein